MLDFYIPNFISFTQHTNKIGEFKVEKPLKSAIFGLFFNTVVIKGYQLKKLLEVVRIFEVVQTTLGGNQTCSFRDI